MADLSIKTTNGETFTEQQSRELATLIYKRFGRNSAVAAAGWRRLLQNSCPDKDFMNLVTEK